MALENQPQAVEPTPSGDGNGDEDLATLAGGFKTDEPAPDLDTDEEVEEAPEGDEPTDEPEQDLTGDEVPDEEAPAGEEPSALSDESEVTLEDGEKVSLSELKETYRVFKGSKDAKAMRGTYLRHREELANERKQFEAERVPLVQAKDQLESMRDAFEADPVAYGLHALKLGVQGGSVDKGMVEAIQAVIDEYAQNGAYNPHALQAQAAQRQAQRMAQTQQREMRKQQFKTQLWDLQEKVGRILNEEERTQLTNAWEHLAVTKGARPSLEDAWAHVQKFAKPATPQKPVARPSPVKAPLRKPKKATTERPGGSGRTQGYNKADLDRDLDFIARL
jgi:hypothetical protein